MKKCPFCAEQIQDEAIKCRYCGSMLDGSVSPSRSGAAYDADVIRLMAEGEKIAAIKLVRQKTGAGLAEAKAYVEAIAVGGTPPVLPSATATVSMPPAPAGGGSRIPVLLAITIVAAIAIWWFFVPGSH